METFKSLLSFVLKVFKNIFIKFYLWTRDKIRNKNYETIYASYGITLVIFTINVYMHPNKVSYFLLWFFIIVTLTINIIVLCKIRKSERGSKEYFNEISNWSFSMTYVSLFILMGVVRIIHTSPLVTNLFVVFFFIFIYFKARFLFLDKVTNWFRLVLLLLFSPVISVVIYSFIGMLLFEVFEEKLFIANGTLGGMVIILSIVLINLVVFWTPEERFNEVKVAIYFILALFSTISYCFFISDFLSTLLTPWLNSISATKVTSEGVRQLIENAVRWFTLPYLIGSVFSCFSLELVSRNRALVNNSKKRGTLDSGSFSHKN
ncbi:hypothetical protein UY456_15885 [Paenibacillus polymyxa]|uniref:hypothetical protein n=1 Tax=Paenibacillus TaxID=44249 RepID=UPI00046F729A|nr:MULTISPECIES: hypothetical protein [Paenibacillus]MDY8094479.1 hypothetical protein [Paenibacillus polymyxa]